MRIVYVGDNRNRGNFGCRATSTALAQLIEKENEIVGTVSGKYTNSDDGQLFFYQHFPKGIYKRLGQFKYWKDLKTGLYLFARMLKGHNFYFSNFDFVDYDFEKSVNNLINCIPANPGLREMDLRQYEFDALVVNGEGSFIFATPAWRECLVEAMLMWWALKLGKKVYYLNGMLSDDPYTQHNEKTVKALEDIFRKCEVVQVREMESYGFAKKYFSIKNIIMKPDALFSWYNYINDDYKVTDGKYIIGPSGASNESFEAYDFSKDYLCIAGSSSVGLASRDENKIVTVYENLVQCVKREIDLEIYLVEVCEGDKFLRDVSKKTNTKIIPIDTPILSAAKILSNARVFISGRYHPAILASMGGTPCVFMSSNSHKTKSLQELLQYEEVHEYNVLPDKSEIEQIIMQAKKKIDRGEELREIIKKRCYVLQEQSKSIAELIR